MTADSARDPAGWLGALVYGVVLTVVGWLRHRNGWSGALDLGIFDQGIWLLSEGHAPEVTVNGRNLFADHLSPALLVFVPLYVVAATPIWLLAGQAASLAVGLPAMRRLARSHGVDARSVTAAYVLSAPLLAAAVFDMHPSTLAIGPLCWLLVALDGKRWVPVAGWAVAVVLCRADLGWLLAATAIAAPRRHRWLLIGIGLTATAAGYVVPSAFGGEGTFEIHYGHIADSPGEVVRAPWELLTAFDAKDLVTVFLWALGAGLAVAFARRWALAVLVAAVPVLLSRWPGTEDPFNHYGAPYVPLVLAGAVTGLATAHRWARAEYLVAGAAVAALLASPLSPKAPEERSVTTALQQNFDGRLDEALDAVPAGEPVAAVNRVLSHLTHRELAYGFPIPFEQVPLAPLYGDADRAAAAAIHVVVIDEDYRTKAEALGFELEKVGPLLIGRR